MIFETFITGFEASPPLFVSVRGADPNASATIVSSGTIGSGNVWPTEGDKVLEVSWSTETDLKVETNIVLTSDTFDLDGHDKLMIDMYIPSSVSPGVVGVWDAQFGWNPILDTIALDQWFTAKFDVSDSVNRGLNAIGALVFEQMASSSGSLFVDNVRLQANGPPSATTDDEYLDNVQRSAFSYFWDFAHPISGLARESLNFHSEGICAAGATGMGIISIVTGCSRGFVSRANAAGRVLKIARFLEDDADRFHGVWPHWMDGETGATVPFSQYDNGADLVETSLIIQGLLVARQYFDSADPAEVEIRERTTRLWCQVEWNWFRRMPETNGDLLYWHWSPNFGWAVDLPLIGYSEAMVVYILGTASPNATNRLPATLYQTSWLANPSYANPGTFYGKRQWVGPEVGGPLFWQHYSFLGLDPRNLSDGYCNYFRNSRNIGLIHQQHAIENPLNHVGYGANSWGLTSSFGPNGYGAWSPTNDGGTIAPTAALSNMPFTPNESMLALKHFYNDFGSNLWGPYGFVDAFNEGSEWYAVGYLGIDQGPIAPMIENFRTGLCWELFMSSPEIQPALDSLGFIKDPLENLLVNPGFEDGESGHLSSVSIPGWITFGTDGWIHDDQGEKLGSRGLKVWNSYVGVFQDFAATAGTSYTIAGYMATFSRETTLSDRNAVLGIEWLDRGNNLIQTNTVGILTGTDPVDTWTSVELSMVAPTGTVLATLIAYTVDAGVSPTGVAHFDGFSAVKLDNA